MCNIFIYSCHDLCLSILQCDFCFFFMVSGFYLPYLLIAMILGPCRILLISFITFPFSLMLEIFSMCKPQKILRGQVLSCWLRVQTEIRLSIFFPLLGDSLGLM